MPNFSSLGWFSKQLVVKKISWQKWNLESWRFAHVSNLVCTWKFQSNFIHISCHQLSTAVNSWWQLIKVDEIENQPRELKFGMHITLSVYTKIPLEFCSYQLASAVNSWGQLMTADNSWWKWKSTKRAENLHRYQI